MSAADFIVTEPKLAEALGVPRKVVKACRSDVLEQGTDWTYDLGGTGAVRFSRNGIERALAHLGVDSQKISSLLPPAPSGLPSASALAMAAPQAPSPVANSLPNLAETTPEQALDLTEPTVVEVTVRRTYPLNRRIVTGTLADERECRVRVRSSEKLRPGMVLRCVHAEDDIYELAQGERLPRFPGKR